MSAPDQQDETVLAEWTSYKGIEFKFSQIKEGPWTVECSHWRYPGEEWQCWDTLNPARIFYALRDRILELESELATQGYQRPTKSA